ncbi:MAG: hypothetical protein WC455_20750 [Dehalococcoidia bacterium]
MSNKPNSIRLLERSYTVLRKHKRKPTVKSSLEVSQLLQKVKGKVTR